jgi:hypothetical protein
VGCDEFGCDAYLNGWRTIVDEATPLGQFQADYVRSSSGRVFDEDRDEAGLTVFTFSAGQMPFASTEHEHVVRRRLEREPNYRVTGGDDRIPDGLRPVLRRHTNGIDWRDDFGEHQQRIADQIERG